MGTNEKLGRDLFYFSDERQIRETAVVVNFNLFLSFPPFFRQIVARTVLETLRVVTGQAENVSAVLSVMNKLADDVG